MRLPTQVVVAPELDVQVAPFSREDADELFEALDWAQVWERIPRARPAVPYRPTSRRSWKPTCPTGEHSS